ncbi:hypothetical protein J3459_018130 [Metarhizium acridum]|nr:hypothetical protein J3459_018130 [Metarhizium acridum]
MRCLPCSQPDMSGPENIDGFLIMGLKMGTDDMDQMYGRDRLDVADTRGIPCVTYCAYANFTSPVSSRQGSFWISTYLLPFFVIAGCLPFHFFFARQGNFR